MIIKKLSGQKKMENKIPGKQKEIGFSCKGCDFCRRDEFYYGYLCEKGAGNVTKYVEQDKKNPFCPGKSEGK